MVENLTESAQPFKASMTFKDLNFDTDKAAQYSAYRTEWLLFIVMMKLYLAQLRLQIGRRLLTNCHRKIRYNVKRDLDTKSFDCETKEWDAGENKRHLVVIFQIRVAFTQSKW